MPHYYLKNTKRKRLLIINSSSFGDEFFCVKKGYEIFVASVESSISDGCRGLSP